MRGQVLVTALFCFQATNSATVTVNIARSKLTEIPDTIPEDVTHLDATNNDIYKLDTIPPRPIYKLQLGYNYLYEFPNLVNIADSLTSLNLDFNNISIIEPERLNVLTKLREVSFRQNPLSFIPDVRDVQTLETLNLYQCVFTEVPVFHYLGISLKSLSLSYNLLTAVNAEDFTHMMNLTILSFYKNKITNFTLPKFDNLKSLDISTNQLTEFPDVSHFSTLQILSIKDNKLTSVPEEMLINLHVLRSLDLTSNDIPLEQIPDVVGPNGTLRNLQLGYNKIYKMPKWENINRNLTSLGLSGINISELTDEHLDNFPMLANLVVSDSDLLEFPYLPRNGPRLKSLNLYRTKISALPIESLKPLENATKIACSACYDIQSIPNFCFADFVPKFELALGYLRLPCDSSLLRAMAAAETIPTLKLNLYRAICTSPPELKDRYLTEVTVEDFEEADEKEPFLGQKFKRVFPPFNCDFPKTFLTRVNYVMMCAVKCSQTGSCLMFGFHPDDGTCVLSSITGTNIDLPEVEYQWFAAK